MSTGAKVGIAIVVTFLVGCCGLMANVMGIYNDCIRQEASLKAQYKDNQNIYASFTNKVQEVAQVPSMYKDDLKEVVTAEIQGKYGKDGSQAMFQWLKDRNLEYDPSMYKKIQQVIESGRNDFEQGQRMLLDKKRVYEDVTLKTLWTGTVAGFLGFPKIDIDEMDIVTSSDTKEAFDTKQAGPLKLR